MLCPTSTPFHPSFFVYPDESISLLISKSPLISGTEGVIIRTKKINKNEARKAGSLVGLVLGSSNSWKGSRQQFVFTVSHHQSVLIQRIQKDYNFSLQCAVLADFYIVLRNTENVK